MGDKANKPLALLVCLHVLTSVLRGGDCGGAVSADKNRFAQLQRILYVLTTPEMADQHPSSCLMQLEDVSREIR